MVKDEEVRYPECQLLPLPPPKLGERGQGGVLVGEMIREEEITNPECQLPPPNIGEGGQGGALFGRTVRDTPTEKDRRVLPTDFKEMTTKYTTESLLDYQNCYLVIENVEVENVDLKIGQLQTGRSSSTGTVPKRSKNTSSVPKRKMNK